ncbi:MAG: hypothetical protein ACTTKD_07610 [Peptoanaerobacter stomatis]|uniref:hypothetical protein n=1 Tax=Peptoanaerobacter stomatis TaxID=796937 RepID=UPI003FA05096
METLFDTIIERFLYKVEKDRSFFNYYKINDSESLEIVKKRAMNYLSEAVSVFKLKSNINYLLFEYNDDKTGFKNELTDDEIYIIVGLMYEIHLKRDLLLLKVMSERYAPADLKIFSPANERNSFLNLVSSVEKENEILLDTYNARDRLDGSQRILNYSS